MESNSSSSAYAGKNKRSLQWSGLETVVAEAFYVDYIKGQTWQQVFSEYIDAGQFGLCWLLFYFLKRGSFEVECQSDCDLESVNFVLEAFRAVHHCRLPALVAFLPPTVETLSFYYQNQHVALKGRVLGALTGLFASGGLPQLQSFRGSIQTSEEAWRPRPLFVEGPENNWGWKDAGQTADW